MILKCEKTFLLLKKRARYGNIGSGRKNFGGMQATLAFDSKILRIDFIPPARQKTNL